jgi:16S rRNA (uracil1498-N3)-methyltransferase
MQIDELKGLDDLLKELESTRGISLSTDAQAEPLLYLKSQISDLKSQMLLLVGPEGGWTDREVAMMRQAGLTGARLTGTILRIETAAIVAAAVVQCART